MTIYNRTEFTPELMKKFARRALTVMNKARWLNYICTAVILISAVLVVLASVFLPELWLYSALILVIFAGWMLVIFLSQKKIADSYRQRGISEMKYEFTMEGFKVEILSEMIGGNETYSYEIVDRVWETREAFYIRVKTLGFFIVSKSGFDKPEEAVHLRKVLWEVMEPKYDVIPK